MSQGDLRGVHLGTWCKPHFCFLPEVIGAGHAIYVWDASHVAWVLPALWLGSESKMSLEVTSRQRGSQEGDLGGSFMALARLAWEVIHCHFHCILLVRSDLRGHLRFKGQRHRCYLSLGEVPPNVTHWSLLDGSIKKETQGFLTAPLMSSLGEKPRSKSHALFE